MGYGPPVCLNRVLNKIFGDNLYVRINNRKATGFQITITSGIQ